jgi:hypothetical protein
MAFCQLPARIVANIKKLGWIRADETTSPPLQFRNVKLDENIVPRAAPLPSVPGYSPPVKPRRRNPPSGRIRSERNSPS